MPRRGNTTVPYTNVRRSVRQAQLLSTSEPSTVEPTPSTTVTSETAPNNMGTSHSNNTLMHNAQTTSHVNNVQSNYNNSLSLMPSMDQFNSLSNTILELKDMLRSITSTSTSINAVTNQSNDHTVVTHDSNNVAHIPNMHNTQNVSTSAHSVDNYQLPNFASSISQVVDQQVNSLISQGENPHRQGNFDDISRSIDLKVTDKIKNLIWSNQYVELSTLLDSKSDIQDGFKIISGEGDTLCLTTHKPTKKITNLGLWCDAFLIYLTVYSRKYTTVTPQLTTYMHNVKMLAHKGGDFIYYDEEFRFMRQRNPAIGWEIDSNLWLECRDVRGVAPRSSNNIRPKSNSNFRPQSSTTSVKSPHPTGYCYKFHGQGRCPNNNNCMYKHICYTPSCGARHPIYNCPKRTTGATNNNRDIRPAKQPAKGNNNSN